MDRWITPLVREGGGLTLSSTRMISAEVHHVQTRLHILQGQIKNANEKDHLLSEKGMEFTKENAIRHFKLIEIKTMLKWKTRKTPIGNKHSLIDAYFNLPDPEEIVQWTEEQENELSELKQKIVDMKDTAVVVSINQMARGISNNISLLDKLMKERLREKLAE